MLTADGTRVRGLLPAAHLQWVREYFGDRVASRVLSAMPVSAAAEVRAADRAGWCSLQSALLLDSTIAEVCGRNPGQTHRELGRYTARVGLTDRDRSLLRSDPHRFLRCSAARDALFQARASCRYEQNGSTSGRMIATGVPVPGRGYCETMEGWLEEVLRLAGGEKICVTEQVCRTLAADQCTFTMTWC